jgi:hypothetical protein
MRGITRRRAFAVGAALLSIILTLGMFVANVAISMAQVDGDHDKIAVTKVAAHDKIKEGDTRGCSASV